MPSPKLETHLIIAATSGGIYSSSFAVSEPFLPVFLHVYLQRWEIKNMPTFVSKGLPVIWRLFFLHNPAISQVHLKHGVCILCCSVQ